MGADLGAGRCGGWQPCHGRAGAGLNEDLAQEGRREGGARATDLHIGERRAGGGTRSKIWTA
eukprot:1105100-Pyramimonas_sp.AAC.1